MIKRIPKPAQIATMVIFALSVFSLTLYLWISFGGPVPLQPKGYRVTIAFREAVQLATEADVRISGVRIGKVKSVTANLGRTDAVLELEQRYAPLPRDARATLRLKTLLGETYVEISPGTKSPKVPTIPEGGRLATTNVDDIVELDEFIRIFDRRTRKSLQTWLEQQAIALHGQGGNLNEALGTLPIFFSEGRNVLEILNGQNADTKKLISSSADVFEAIDSRPGQLTELVTQSNKFLRVTARRNQELAQAFREFPAFLKESQTTIKEFTQFANDTNEFVQQSTEIANELAPTLKLAKPVTTDAKELVQNLDPLLNVADKNLPYVNEFLDLAQPVFSQLDPFLRNLNPWFEFIGLYQREIVGALANDAAASQGVAGSVQKTGKSTDYLHVLRGLVTTTPESLTYTPSRYANSRGNAYPVPGSYDSLLAGLKVFDAAHCTGLNVPPLDPNDAVYPSDLLSIKTLIQKYVYGGSDAVPVPAPACSEQTPMTFQGQTLKYPHVQENTTP